jgi:hypothetical protein
MSVSVLQDFGWILVLIPVWLAIRVVKIAVELLVINVLSVN